jgi:hypothetical protein
MLEVPNDRERLIDSYPARIDSVSYATRPGCEGVIGIGAGCNRDFRPCPVLPLATIRGRANGDSTHCDIG